MASKNLFTMLIIIVIIFAVSYCYFHITFSNKQINSNLTTAQTNLPKKVRFNNTVDYKTVDKLNLSDSALDLLESDNVYDSLNFSQLEQDSDEEYNNTYNDVGYSNIYSTNSNLKWDKNFNLPLIDNCKKQKFISNMKKLHSEYEVSMDNFIKYKNNSNRVNKNTSNINPFVSNNELKKNKKLKNKAISEIYNNQVKNPSATPMKIKNSGFDKTYVDELELNGGKLQQSNLHAFDSDHKYSNANFHNQF